MHWTDKLIIFWKTGSIKLMVPSGLVICLNRDCFTYTFHPKPSRLHFSECKWHVTENRPNGKFVACGFNMRRRQSFVPLEDSISSHYSTSSNRRFFRLTILCTCSRKKRWPISCCYCNIQFQEEKELDVMEGPNCRMRTLTT